MYPSSTSHDHHHYFMNIVDFCCKAIEILISKTMCFHYILAKQLACKHQTTKDQRFKMSLVFLILALS